MVLLDGYDNFPAAYESVDRGCWIDLLPRLVADGRAVGAHLVLTGCRRTSFPLALKCHLGPAGVAGWPRDDYLALGADAAWFDPTPQRAGDGWGVSSPGGGAGREQRHRHRGGPFRRLGEALRICGAGATVRVLPGEAHLHELPAPKSGLAWLITEISTRPAPTFPNTC